jgi:hypothetical protein
LKFLFHFHHTRFCLAVVLAKVRRVDLLDDQNLGVVWSEQILNNIGCERFSVPFKEWFDAMAVNDVAFKTKPLTRP